MLFTTITFWFFFLCVFFLYWKTKSTHKRNTILLIASYIFYAAWDWRFLGLLFLVTLIAYYFGHKTNSEANPLRKKRYMRFAVVLHLCILGGFKYFNFFVNSFASMIEIIGFDAGFTTLSIILPVGISFYIFQAISYNVDIYRKKVDRAHSFKTVAFYISFFPQLVAGPIVRASDFFIQIEVDKHLPKYVIRSAVRIILIGFVYKALLADNIAPYVDDIYRDISRADHSDMILATLGFHSQIYFDFAGYTFIAIGLARLFGYRIPKNFNYPYLAYNITDFWRRWHISLSSWLRDYLYVPLGGNRNGQTNMYINLMITMVLGGLWHGAAWTFVFWGTLHGLALVIHKLYRSHFNNHKIKCTALQALLSLVLTQYFVLICWIFFRALNFADAMSVLSAFCSPSAFCGVLAFSSATTIFISLPLVIDHIIGRYQNLFASHKTAIYSNVILGALLGIGTYLAIVLLPLNAQPFVYFQF